MKQAITEIDINGIKYVPKDSIKENNELAKELNGMPYCMVRSEKAGVFMGYVKSRSGNEVELLKARRIWYWAGAASLSQLSQEGTSSPKQCKFPCEVDKVTLLGVIEIDSITEKAKLNLNLVPVWKQ